MKNRLMLSFVFLCFIMLCSCDTSSKPNENEDDTHIYTLRGYLLPSYPNFGAGITLEEPLTLTRTSEDGSLSVETFHAVFFSGTEIYDYVHRKHFVYQNDDLSIAETARVPVEIEFDFSAYFNTGKVLNDAFLWTDQYHILEVDGSTTLEDQTQTAYTLSTYKDIFYHYCRQSHDILPKNVKETYCYMNTDTEIGSIYKDAVDTILESGLYIFKQNNSYTISETDSISNPIPINSVQLGDIIGGLEVILLEYEKGQDIHMELAGSINIYGNLVYDEFMQAPYFISTSHPFSSPIEYTFDSGFVHTLDSFNGRLQMVGSQTISPSALLYLEQGNELAVAITIEGFSMVDRDMSQGDCLITASDIALQPTESE